jgi:hypothetical protein
MSNIQWGYLLLELRCISCDDMSGYNSLYLAMLMIGNATHLIIWLLVDFNVAFIIDTFWMQLKSSLNLMNFEKSPSCQPIWKPPDNNASEAHQKTPLSHHDTPSVWVRYGDFWYCLSCSLFFLPNISLKMKGCNNGVKSSVRVAYRGCFLIKGAS